MNFENKQFKMGRFCERICMMRDDFREVNEWISFVNEISREFDVKLNDKILLASIKLNYDFDEKIIIKVGRQNYYLVGKWNENSNHTGIEIKSVYGGIIYIQDDKIKLLDVDIKINLILQKIFEVLHN